MRTVQEGATECFTRWNDYVYKNLPIDDAYWKMRVFGGYAVSSQLGARQEDAIPHRTFELWLYTDFGGEKPKIFDTVLDENRLYPSSTMHGNSRNGKYFSRGK